MEQLTESSNFQFSKNANCWRTNTENSKFKEGEIVSYIFRQKYKNFDTHLQLKFANLKFANSKIDNLKLDNLKFANLVFANLKLGNLQI